MLDAFRIILKDINGRVIEVRFSRYLGFSENMNLLEGYVRCTALLVYRTLNCSLINVETPLEDLDIRDGEVFNVIGEFIF